MKRLKKFEELDYSTYMSAADRLQKIGQIDRADDIRDHAADMSKRRIQEETFKIIVGDVREFPQAKFNSLSTFKSGSSWLIRGIFQSGNSTHRIDCDLNFDGQIIWKAGNKFGDRISVRKFQKVILQLAPIQDDFQDMLQKTGLDVEDLKLEDRTFYN